MAAPEKNLDRAKGGPEIFMWGQSLTVTLQQDYPLSNFFQVLGAVPDATTLILYCLSHCRIHNSQECLFTHLQQPVRISRLVNEIRIVKLYFAD